MFERGRLLIYLFNFSFRTIIK